MQSWIFSIINLKQNSVLTWSHESVYTARVLCLRFGIIFICRNWLWGAYEKQWVGLWLWVDACNMYAEKIICMPTNCISLHAKLLKTAALLVETRIQNFLRVLWWIEIHEHHLFEIEIVWKKKYFFVTFDHLDANCNSKILIVNVWYKQCWGKLLLKVMHYNIASLPKKVTNYVT